MPKRIWKTPETSNVTAAKYIPPRAKARLVPLLWLMTSLRFWTGRTALITRRYFLLLDRVRRVTMFSEARPAAAEREGPVVPEGAAWREPERLSTGRGSGSASSRCGARPRDPASRVPVPGRTVL